MPGEIIAVIIYSGYLKEGADFHGPAFPSKRRHATTVGRLVAVYGGGTYEKGMSAMRLYYVNTFIILSSKIFTPLLFFAGTTTRMPRAPV